MKLCCHFSKSFRPDKIPSHVFEIDEDFEKDEVRRFWFLHIPLQDLLKSRFHEAKSEFTSQERFCGEMLRTVKKGPKLRQ